MKATIGHIGINLSNGDESFRFWKELLRYLDFSFADETSTHFDAKDGNSYLCVSTTWKGYEEQGYHRKRTGLSHIAFRVSSPDQVDQFVSEFLQPRGIEPLYGGARAYPEYAEGYYAVFFEDPDRIKIEVVHEII